MGPLPLDLERLQEHLGELLAELLLGAQLPQGQADPAPVVSAFGRALEAMTRLDAEALREPSDTARAIPRAATTLGESTHRLLNLAAQCLDGDAPARSEQLSLLHVGFAYWVARHGGNITSLAALVDHLARLDSGDAGDRFDPVELATVMSTLIDSLAAYRRAEMRSPDPRDPWRLLHLHAYDAAQRTQRNDLLQQAHARLRQHLPGDVARCSHTDTPRLQTTAPAKARPGTRTDNHRRAILKPTLH